MLKVSLGYITPYFSAFVWVCTVEKSAGLQDLLFQSQQIRSISLLTQTCCVCVCVCLFLYFLVHIAPSGLIHPVVYGSLELKRTALNAALWGG